MDFANQILDGECEEVYFSSKCNNMSAKMWSISFAAHALARSTSSAQIDQQEPLFISCQLCHNSE